MIKCTLSSAKAFCRGMIHAQKKHILNNSLHDLHLKHANIITFRLYYKTIFSKPRPRLFHFLHKTLLFKQITKVFTLFLTNN